MEIVFRLLVLLLLQEIELRLALLVTLVDGRIKPDVMANGSLSVRCSYSFKMDMDILMELPLVVLLTAGVVAQLLQYNPSLKPMEMS